MQICLTGGLGCLAIKRPWVRYIDNTQFALGHQSAQCFSRTCRSASKTNLKFTVAIMHVKFGGLVASKTSLKRPLFFKKQIWRYVYAKSFIWIEYYFPYWFRSRFAWFSPVLLWGNKTIFRLWDGSPRLVGVAIGSNSGSVCWATFVRPCEEQSEPIWKLKKR